MIYQVIPAKLNVNLYDLNYYCSLLYFLWSRVNRERNTISDWLNDDEIITSQGVVNIGKAINNASYLSNSIDRTINMIEKYIDWDSDRDIDKIVNMNDMMLAFELQYPDTNLITIYIHKFNEISNILVKQLREFDVEVITGEGCFDGTYHGD